MVIQNNISAHKNNTETLQSRCYHCSYVSWHSKIYHKIFLHIFGLKWHRSSQMELTELLSLIKLSIYSAKNYLDLLSFPHIPFPDANENLFKGIHVAISTITMYDLGYNVA